VIHNIFAMELCLRLEKEDQLRGKLKELIVSHPDATTPGRKWKLLRDAAALLADHHRLFDRGCWDFFDDDGRALKDYDMWSNGMISKEGARGAPSGKPGWQDSAPRYMTFTIALLLVAGSPTARSLGALCDYPEAKLWKRETFVAILRGLTCVSFASVKSDIYYLIPGDESWGLTNQDLADEKFAYFRKVE
jgi:hypothetical protein